MSEKKLQELVTLFERMIAAGHGTPKMQWFVDCAKAYFNDEFKTIDQALMGLEPEQDR